jgi:hypothetical protein
MFPPVRSRFRRISRRWAFPAAGILLALSGLGLIAAAPDDATPRARHEPSPVVAWAPRKLLTPLPETAGTITPPQAAPRDPEREPVHPMVPATRSAAGSSFEREIEEAPDLVARLAIVDRLMQSELPGTVVALIKRLLEQTPGSADEIKPFRVALLGRLGYFPQNAEADERLCAALEPDRPRFERLIAIEALARGGLHPLGRPYLQRIADSDHDLEVRRHAQWALGIATQN